MVQNAWYAVMASRSVRRRPVGAVRMGRRMVFWRGADGRVVAMEDRCPHKGVALSGGRVVDGQIRCPYHGFAFDGGGQCRHMPVLGDAVRPSMCVQTWPAREADGLVFIWWGEPADAASTPLPRFDAVRERPAWTSASAEIAYPLHYSRVIETNFDFYHAAFAHRSLNVGGLFGARVDGLEVEHDAATGATAARGRLVDARGRRALPFETRFLPGNVQLVVAGGQTGLAATVPVDEAHAISIFRVYSDVRVPGLGALLAWLVVLSEKHLVQPQDVALMDTMTDKACGPGASRWVEADLGAARYVRWRARRLRDQETHAPTEVRQAGP